MGAIYNIPYSCSFVDTLVRKISKEFEGSKEKLVDVIFLMPNRRTCISLKEAFIRYNGQKPVMLPKIIPVGDIEEDDIFLLNANNEEFNDSILPAIREYERLFLFAKLIVSKPADYGMSEMNFAQALSLAKDLALLIDVSYNEGISFNELKNIVPEQFATHWQQTLEFLKIITDNWPKILNEKNVTDLAYRKNMLIELKASLWQQNKTKQKIIAAGITAGYESFHKLVKIVSELENGEVFLYGLDKTLSDNEWDLIGPTHPQFELKKLLSYLSVDRFDVADYIQPTKPQRERFISEVMLPAKATSRWRDLHNGSYSFETIEGISFIECADDRQEALSVALILRETLNNPSKTAALVTTDRNLARRTATELERWGIKIDDSAGKPLHLTPVGVFLRLILNVIETDFSLLSILALVKNPFVKMSLEPTSLLKTVRNWEYNIRKPIFSEQSKQIPEELSRWIIDLKELLRPLYELFQQPAISLSKLIKTHLEVAETLCADNQNSGEQNLWKGDDGKSAAELFGTLLQQSDIAGTIAPDEYINVFTLLLSTKNVRYNYGTHPRLKILGPIEARFNRYDTIVIGAVNEGFWPELPKADPWLSRPMKSLLNMSLPDKEIGIAGFDFCQLMCSDNVFITRSNRSNSSPTNKSRWLLRMETVLKACNINRSLIYDKKFLQMVYMLDRPTKLQKINPPAPTPPVEARPRTLSASAIEILMRDPYEIYAKYILKLKPLEDLETPLNASDYGNLIHKVLEKFNTKFPNELPNNAYSELIQIALDEFSKTNADSQVRAFWWPLLEKTAKWIIKTETEYRKNIKHTYAEVQGDIQIQSPAGVFTITARADRIDITTEGKIKIVDYKTGTPRSKNEVNAGYAPQLPIEGLIASKGGFNKEINGKKFNIKALPIDELSYWKLGDKVICYNVTDEDYKLNLIEKTEDNLQKLVSLFDFKTTPYIARPNPKHLPKYSDYEHLARVKEWAVEADDE